MKLKRAGMLIGSGLLLALLVSACGGADPTATVPPTAPPRPAATPVATSAPTQAAPTATAALPAATATPVRAAPSATAAPAPTATVVRPAPTATSAPAPTPSPAPAATPAGPAPRRGGVLKQGAPESARSFQLGVRNAQLGPGNFFAAALIYQPLFQQDPYDGYAFKGLLVDKWQFNATVDQVTIELKRDARWADGKPVTSQDVKFTLESFATPPRGFTAEGSAKTAGAGIARIDIVDDRTARIGLKAPDVSYLAFLATPNAPLRPAHRTLEQSATDPVGSGPYMVKEVQADVKANFVKNPNYWQKDARGGALPYLDGVENIVLSDPSRTMAAFFTGGVDVLNTNWSPIVSPSVSEVKKRMPQALIQTRVGGNFGWGVKNAAPLNNPLVMRALSIITDRLTLMQIAWDGEAVIDAIGVLPASSGSDWSLPMKEILSTPGFRYVNKKTGELETDMLKLKEGLTTVYTKDPKDIALAKDLLKQAGMDPEKGQFPKITITSADRYETRYVPIAQTLKEHLGIDSTLDISEFTTFQEKTRQGQFQAIVYALYGSTIDPSPTLLRFTTGNGLWPHGFRVPELDALFEQQKRATDPVQRRAIAWEFQRKFLALPHIIPGGNPVGAGGVVREYVKNMPMPVVGEDNVFDLDRVWLEK